MKRQQQSGYSLVEVLIALAITSIVLLTVVTLFYMGRRNVYSGKQMTYAVSVGTRILEDLSSLTSQDVGSSFNITDTTATGTVRLYSSSFPNGYLDITGSTSRDTSGCTGSGSPVVYTCTNDPNGYLAAWNGLIQQATVGAGATLEHGKLANAQAGLVLTPRAATDATKPWSTANFIKVRAYIQWDEAQNRRRIAFFDTTKVNRP
jgi:prepilin-type N-terminal cleavage/methylation domain-containing protein